MKTHRYSLAAALVAVLIVPAARADYPSTVLSLNPVAYYRLNETTPVPADTATNLGMAGVNGTGFYINSPAHQSPGALVGSSDTAIGLNGSNQRVATLYDTAISPTGPFTAEAWLNPATEQSGSGLVCPLAYWTEAAGTTGRTGWLIYQSPTGWNLRFYNGINSSTVVNVTGGTAPTVGSWYHLVVVYDGANVNLYVNGVPTGPQSTSGYAPNIGGAFSIGARSDGNFWFAGYADEVALYTNVLSATDIQGHYQNGISPSPSQPYNSLVLAKNPVLYYRLNEPDPAGGTLPTAVNQGSALTDADGIYQAGTVTGVSGPPYAGFGAGNYACLFNGFSGYIDCGFPPELDAYSGPISIITWIRANGWNKPWQAMVTKGDNAWRLHRAQVSSTDTRFVGFGTTGLNPQDQAGTRAVDDGYWHQIVAVYDGSTKYIYVDGTLDVSNAVTGTLAVNSQPIFIGENAGARNRYFTGLMDEVAIFTTGLTASQVSQVYNAAQVPPVITQIQRTPADPLFEGYNITMTAAVLGATPMTNRWYKSTTLLNNRTNLTLSISNAAVGDSGNYTLVVANAYGSSTSAVQVITVSAGPPIILSQSITNATRAVGGRVTYSVVAGGSAPVAYQWNHNSAPIPGATSSVLRLTNLQLPDQGAYTVTLSNPYGTNNNSATGVVSVLPVTNFPFAGMYGNPMAYYRLNETSGTTAVDIAGGLAGTIVNSPVLGADGPRPPAWAGLESTNTAFQFNAASQTRVQLPPFNLQTNHLTIVAWINPAGPQSDQTGIVSTRNGNDIGGFFLNYNNNNALSYVWAGSGSWANFQSGLVPVVGQWNFVALVIEPTVGTVYLDSGSGLQSSSYSGANQTVAWTNPNIGEDPGYTRYFDGSIDEVIIYDRSLSPAEIANLELLSATSPWPRPLITTQPSPLTVFAGQSASFTVGAQGGVPLAYQWQRDGTKLPGATSPTLTISNVYFTDAGNYSAVITNGSGSSNSVAASLTVLAPPTFADLTNGLVLHLKFDGNYLDSSGRTNNATAVGTPPFVPGKLGQAMHYNTDNSNPNNIIYNYATLGTPADLQFGTSQNFSVSYWVRFTGASIDLPVLCNNNCGDGCIGFYFGPSWHDYANGTWAWTLKNGSYNGPEARGAANSINDGQWHNVVSTFDRTGLANTYLDGVAVDSQTISSFTDTLDTPNPVNVGQVGTADYNVVFGADVDDLGVWQRALSPSEAESIYLVGQQGRSFDTYGPVIITLRKAGSDLELVWQTGTLLSSTTGVNGTYNPVPGASAPYYRVTPGPTPTFYRVRY
jgi:hypothetical protein